MDSLIEELRRRRTLPDEGLRTLLGSDSLEEDLHGAAREVALESFGNKVCLRALIEWSNVCRRDCYYCGIRKSNPVPERYSLTKEEILACCDRAWKAGIATFVLQGGENPLGARSLISIVSEIRASWKDAAITLSLGELPFDIYKGLKEAGADRYLLRHESASPSHYSLLHPAGMTLKSRLECLKELRRLGYQTGMGMMVGTPSQGISELIADIRLMEEFRPEMIGIGPFIPQKDTPFRSFQGGSASLTLRLYSIMRLMMPDALIPSTTALSTIMKGGRKAGILSGANVIMPDFTPPAGRREYTLYEGKPSADPSESLPEILSDLESIGYCAAPGRGDHKRFENV